ncbi:MAG: hypothetical protein SVR94_11210, partial [Pseudomonadota bacterium]|nr:hypothetical protein [Pseudomonadota bacterium]
MIKKKKVRVKDSEKGFSDNNDLFSYLDAAMEASRKSYEGHRDNLKCLFNVDSLFVDLIPYATKIKPSTSAVLLLNTHSVYRSAIQLSLSGQNIPVFMALRGAIESALYANAMVMKPELEHIWLNRSKDE